MKSNNNNGFNIKGQLLKYFPKHRLRLGGGGARWVFGSNATKNVADLRLMVYWQSEGGTLI